MNKLFCLVSGVLLLVAASHAIGLQHGVFRSQSTQGTAWQGTATITSEKFDITVYPDYLDVDLEWVFKVGGTPPDSFKNALEIVGNLNLDAHSTVVGLITWYKGKILKGKLKTDSIAKQQYENVVDRSAACPPPPCDPVLFEYGWGDDNYYISIFPATFDSTRTVRIRYLIPAFDIDGVNKIAYPYSFTANPVISIKKGPGVSGYLVEAARSKKQFDNTMPITLDNAVYSFQAYGSSTGQSISYIIPIPSNASSGSTIYSGTFSTPSFGGEMCHITTMTAAEALAQSSVKEDYVVLWRWNHPKIIARYARQIVEQSTVLTRFLSTLSSANKRAALIISKEGEGPIVFHLDKQGGTEFNRMLSYLDSLKSRTVVDPPISSSYKPLNLAIDTAGELQEFNAAVQAALNLFEKDAASVRHLLILTAGPQLVSISTTAQTIAWDSTIDVNMLCSVLGEKEIDSTITLPLSQAYWPGADISGFMQRYHPRLSAYAVVGNGADTANIPVLVSASSMSYCAGQQTTDMHLYSERPLIKKIRWTVLQGTATVAQFTESPRVVRMANGMQYARLIGSSPYLVPLASQMPTSMASSVGFVDKKYSLVALEQDSLPSTIAALYENQGVPVLARADIFPSATENPEPVATWLSDHPPQSLSRCTGGASYTIMTPGVRVVALAVDDMIAGPVFQANIAGNQPVRLMPLADNVYATGSGSYPDYSDALSVKTELPHASSSGMDIITIKNGFLVINTGRLKMDNGKPVVVSLFDCFGRIIGQWSVTAGQSHMVPLRATLAHGAYIARISCGSAMMVRPVVIR